MLGHATNPFRDQSWGYNSEWWSFEEALDQYVDSEADGVEGTITSGASGGVGGESSPGWWDAESRTDAAVATHWEGMVEWADEYTEASGHDYTQFQSEYGEDLQINDDGSVYLVGADYRGGATRVFSRMGQSDRAREALHAFFPDLPVADTGAGESFIDGQNYITKMMNVGIYYQVPPLTNKGFLDNTRPFAIASKNTYLKMSNTYATDGAVRSGGRGGGSATAIDPCPHCNTIGRANNGKRMLELRSQYSFSPAYGTKRHMKQ